MSNGFAFNFLSAEDDLGTPATPSNDKGWAECNLTATGRFSFDWVDDLGALLTDRAQEELVYTEIPLLTELLTEAAASTTATATTISTHLALFGNGDTNNKAAVVEAMGQQERMIRCVDLSSTSYHVENKNVKQAEGDNVGRDKVDPPSDEERVWKTTDIQTGIYEGGRKVWESSRDLMEFLVQDGIGLNHGSMMTGNEDENESQGRRRHFFCLELGCGHGLPGCYLLREALSGRNQDHDAVESDFSLVLTDYNRSVVLDATVSNLVLNCLSPHIHDFPNEKQLWNGGGDGEDPALLISQAVNTLLQHVRVGAGDWMDMSKKLIHLRNNQETEEQSHDPLLPSDGKFDLILAAETIYSESAARETALLLQRHLRPVTGVAYVATKRYYFGVGGGVAPFRKFASECQDLNNSDDAWEAAPPRLAIETVRVIDNGAGNIREVLKVQCSFD